MLATIARFLVLSWRALVFSLAMALSYIVVYWATTLVLGWDGDALQLIAVWLALWFSYLFLEATMECVVEWTHKGRRQ